jgi:hypothetical protein
MEYINVFITFVLFVLFTFLTGYNLLYAARTSGVNRQLGIGLPPIVRTVFIFMMIASIAATFITLTIFINGVIAL